jgi:hypothetical protein
VDGLVVAAAAVAFLFAKMRMAQLITLQVLPLQN